MIRGQSEDGAMSIIDEWKWFDEDVSYFLALGVKIVLELCH